MSAKQEPIPAEALPPGWGLSDLGDDRFVYQHSNPPIELVADSTPAERSHPGLGLCRCWELRYRYFLQDSTISQSIGHTATRQAAIDGLLECMYRIHETVSTVAGPVTVCAVLDDACLSDPVPDGVFSVSSTERRL